MTQSGMSLRILLLGKRGSLVQWLENLHQSSARLGYPTRTFAINGESWGARIRAKWEGSSAATSPWMLARFERALHDFHPDLVLVVGVFGVPLEYYRILRDQPWRPLIAGLVGDRFPPDQERADRCDRLYFTDSYFFQLAAAAGFATPSHYLPLAVDPEAFRPGQMRRRAELLFIASRTEFREAVVRGLDTPAYIIGTDWSALAREGFHRVHNRKIGRGVVIRRYQRHQAVLNANNEANTAYGLNQRSFEPLACGAVVINDDLLDLPRCFEPGREILVYRNRDELNALVARLRREPDWGAQIAAAGRRRVLAEHTYGHRIRAILADLGL